MHGLSQLTIRNYRSCRFSELQLHDFTPVVSYIWLWKVGTIEDALGSSGKGEQAIQRLELDLPTKTPAEIRSDLPAITALLDWFSPLPTCPTTPP